MKSTIQQNLSWRTGHPYQSDTKPQQVNAQYREWWELSVIKGRHEQTGFFSDKEKQETHSPFLVLAQIYCTAQAAKQNSLCFKPCLKTQSVGRSCHGKPCTVLTLHLISDLRLLGMGWNPHDPFHAVLSEHRHRDQHSHRDLSLNKAGEQSSFITHNVPSEEVAGKHGALFRAISHFTILKRQHQSLARAAKLGRSFPNFEEAGPQVNCWQTTKAHSRSHCPNLS